MLIPQSCLSSMWSCYVNQHSGNTASCVVMHSLVTDRRFRFILDSCVRFYYANKEHKGVSTRLLTTVICTSLWRAPLQCYWSASPLNMWWGRSIYQKSPIFVFLFFSNITSLFTSITMVSRRMCACTARVYILSVSFTHKVEQWKLISLLLLRTIRVTEIVPITQVLSALWRLKYQRIIVCVYIFMGASFSNLPFGGNCRKLQHNVGERK